MSAVGFAGQEHRARAKQKIDAAGTAQYRYVHIHTHEYIRMFVC